MPATLLKAADFLDDFLIKAQQAKQRVWAQSMNFEVGEMMERLTPILLDRAQAGIDVQLEIDWVAQRFVHGYLPLKPVWDRAKRAYGHDLHQRNQAIRRQLIEKGVHITVVNQANLISRVFPAFRRNHIKLFVVDTAFAWVGGVNLLDRAFQCQDFMVRYDTPHEVEILADQFQRVNQHRWPKNQVISLNQTDQLLVDAGKIGRSIIYDRAVQLIEQAQSEIWFVSQFVPEGKLLKALIKASQRGVQVSIVNSYEQAKQRWSSAHRAAYQVFRNEVDSCPQIQFRHSADRLHAKLLITDRQHALFGSHNLVDTGVLMGTEELGIHTYQPELIDQLVTFYKELT